MAQGYRPLSCNVEVRGSIPDEVGNIQSMSGTGRWRLSGKRNSLGGCSCNPREDPAPPSLLPFYMAGWPRGMTIELLTHQSPVRIPVGSSEERQRTGKRREASGGDPRPGELDYWFIALEGRLKAAQFPTTRWAEKFVECPKVDEAIKMRIRDLTTPDYALIRTTILREHFSGSNVDRWPSWSGADRQSQPKAADVSKRFRSRDLHQSHSRPGFPRRGPAPVPNSQSPFRLPEEIVIGKQLSPPQREAIVELLTRFGPVLFSTEEKPYGSTHKGKHFVETGDHPPISQGCDPPRRQIAW